MKVGQCGGRGLKVHFWAIDGARVTCVNCRVDHEVECGEMLDLTTGEKSEVVLLVPVGEVLGDGINGERGEQKTDMKRGRELCY